MYTPQGIDYTNVPSGVKPALDIVVRLKTKDGKGDTEVKSYLTTSGFSKSVINEALARYYASPGTYKAQTSGGGSGGGLFDKILGFFQPAQQQQPFYASQNAYSWVLPVVLIGGAVAVVMLVRK